MAIGAVSGASLQPLFPIRERGEKPDAAAEQPSAALRSDPETQRKLERLREIDREVRAHEMAHVAAGGSLVTRGAQFKTVRGPDGREYAVGGDVQIDVSPGRTPEETIAKAERIQAAALAPMNPSPQDLRVAARAAQMAMAARMELMHKRLETEGKSSGSESGQNVSDTSGPRGESQRGSEALIGLSGSSRSDQAASFNLPQETLAVQSLWRQQQAALLYARNARQVAG